MKISRMSKLFIKAFLTAMTIDKFYSYIFLIVVLRWVVKAKISLGPVDFVVQRNEIRMIGSFT